MHGGLRRVEHVIEVQGVRRVSVGQGGQRPAGALARTDDVTTGSDATEAMTSRNLTDASSVSRPAPLPASPLTRAWRCEPRAGTSDTVTDAAKSAKDLVLAALSCGSVMAFDHALDERLGGVAELLIWVFNSSPVTNCGARPSLFRYPSRRRSADLLEEVLVELDRLVGHVRRSGDATELQVARELAEIDVLFGDVGTFGKSGSRLSENTPISFSFPASIWSAKSGMAPMSICASPRSIAVIRGAPSSNDRYFHLVPEVFSISSATRLSTELGDPPVCTISPGLSLALLRNSAIVLNGASTGAAMTWISSASITIGVRSVRVAGADAR